ncbi:MAG: PEP-CTERM sorting domain-containing protein [Cyanobacteriota bacterium]|nr:PEP-CTERM sorting domain-containing protein [Cyanobacteriota bacterium]
MPATFIQTSAKSLLKLALIAAGTAVTSLGMADVARGARLTFQARGFDSGINAARDRNNFFGVAFNNAPVGTFVESITFNLSPDPNAFFDITPGFPGGPGFDFEVGNTNGITAGDITRSLSPNRRRLTLNFANGAFTAGDSFRFGIDTDRVGPSILGLDFLDPGVDFGLAGVKVSAVLSNGTSGMTRFKPVSFIRPSKSIAKLKIKDPEIVPEPASVVGLLAVAAIGASSSFARKKKGNID